MLPLLTLAVLAATPPTMDDVIAERKRFETQCTAGKGAGCTELGFIYEQGLAVEPDAAKAFSFYTRACDLKHLPGCAQLGLMHKYGRPGPVDITKAVALFKRGCDGKDALSCSNLGAMYSAGSGVPLDDKKALQLYAFACEHGLPLGCTNQAFEIQDVDSKRAVELYKKACEAKELHACVNLGSAYLRGQHGVKADEAEAKRFYERACSLGDEASCRWLRK